MLPRLPGLESSKQNKAQEDAFYNTMMCGLLQIVLRPILDEKKASLASVDTSAYGATEFIAGVSDDVTHTAHSNDGITHHGGSKASTSTVDAEHGDDCIYERMSVSLSGCCGHSSDGWIAVRQGQPPAGYAVSSDETVDPSSEIKNNNTWVNTLKWKAFTRKHRDKVLSSFYL